MLHGFDIPIESAQIDLCADVTPEQELRLCRKDNGKGINQDLQDKVFDPFDTSKHGAGKTGLGLHLIHNIVTQHLKGHITLQSDGKTFTQLTIQLHIGITSG